MLALATAIWALSWAVVATSDVVDPGTAVMLRSFSGLGVFGRRGDAVGADRSGDHQRPGDRGGLRGRYNALQGMTWTVAMVVGPASVRAA